MWRRVRCAKLSTLICSSLSCLYQQRPAVRQGNSIRIIAAVACLLTLSACSTIKYTVDDGRQVDEQLLANIRTYGAAERTVVPAIVRSAALNDKDCDTQWELPLSVATAYEWKPDDRVAWVRGLNVDERLTVIAATPDSGLSSGDKIVEVNGFKSENTENMFTELMDLRDQGRRFFVKLAGGGSVEVTPFKVCRGHVRVAPPNVEEAQDYHWEMSVHPLRVFQEKLTPDEALWIVLWTQGLSEEGGARMKTYQYGKTVVTTLIDLASLVGGVSAIANAAVTSVATTAARNAITKQIAENARATATDDALKTAQDTSQHHAIAMIQDAAANRAGLSGVAWIAGTVFDKADVWAYRRMTLLGADPLAAFSLHYKLMTAGAARNAFVLDPERLPQLTTLAKADNYEYKLSAILRGVVPGTFELNLDEIAQASVDYSTLLPEGKVEAAVPMGYNLGGYISAAADTWLVQQSAK